MNKPRRDGSPKKGAGRSAARESRTNDSGREGRNSTDRPSGGRSGGFSKDRFVRGAAGDDRPERSNDRPQGGDRPFNRDGDRPNRGFSRDGGRSQGGDRPFNRDRPQGDRPERGGFNKGGDRPFNRDRPSGGDRPFNRDRPQGDRPYNRDRPTGDRPDRGGFNRGGDRPSGDRPFNRDRPQGERPFNRDRPSGDRPERGGFNHGGDKPFNRDRPSYGDRPQGDRPERGGFNRGGDKPFNRDRPSGDRPERGGFNRGGDRPFNRDRPSGDRPNRPNRTNRPFNNDRNDRPERSNDRPFNRDRPSGDRPDRGGDRPSFNRGNSYGEEKRKIGGNRERPLRRDDDGEYRKPTSFTENALRREQERTRRKVESAERNGESDNEPLEESDGKIRLNKYIAAAGVCSRREADTYIEEGRIAVNGKTVTELGFKVTQDDEVRLGGRLLKPQKHVYILLNKPKNYITTLEDDGGRQTVMDLIGNFVHERVYPVGRLDRNTTGLLLLTNDGELAERLMHPSFEIRKVYQVDLDNPLSSADEMQIRRGLMLEDGVANVDDMAVLTPDRKSIGLEIHIGRNRIVRRIFEALGYQVMKLDRVMYGGLTKKDLPRGKFRALSTQEIINIKHLGAGVKSRKK